MTTMIVIPARLASGRLAEKLLLRAGGKSVLQWTYEAAKRSTITDQIIVAADDPRLVAEVDSFGGEARLTSVDCQSGTDRIAEIALQNDDVDLFVNVQGDEPELSASTIDAVAGLLASRPDADIATAICPITSESQLNDPACVKVVMGNNDRAITFSRAPVPFAREGTSPAMFQAAPSSGNRTSGNRHAFWQHIGLYAYRRDFLLWFATEPPGQLEQIEKLEQLRAIQAGKTIVAAQVEPSPPGIDTLEDFRKFTARVEGC